MDKIAAMERLDAIEDEAKQLRELISEKDRLIFEKDKLYVGISRIGDPSIMVGNQGSPEYFRFQEFKRGNPSRQGWSSAIIGAQECLDYHAESFQEIRVFSDVRQGFAFFLEHYRG
jgi:hypothetical protein